MGDLTLNFNREEFPCQCANEECDGGRISQDLVNRLQRARDVYGKAIIISSGCRCTKHNASVGGSSTSRHLVKIINKDQTEPRSFAADLIVADLQESFELIEVLLTAAKFRRVGIRAKGERMFIHVDCDPTKPSSRLWTYDSAPADR